MYLLYHGRSDRYNVKLSWRKYTLSLYVMATFTFFLGHISFITPTDAYCHYQSNCGQHQCPPSRSSPCTFKSTKYRHRHSQPIFFSTTTSSSVFTTTTKIYGIICKSHADVDAGTMGYENVKEKHDKQNKVRKSQPEIYLLSLQWSPDDIPSWTPSVTGDSKTIDNDDTVVPSFFSKPVRDVWKWKDTILGDGRDFFIPKPKTLSALQNWFLEEFEIAEEQLPNANKIVVTECSVLSNCARLEVIVVCYRHTSTTSGYDDYSDDDADEEEAQIDDPMSAANRDNGEYQSQLKNSMKVISSETTLTGSRTTSSTPSSTSQIDTLCRHIAQGLAYQVIQSKDSNQRKGPLLSALLSTPSMDWPEQVLDLTPSSSLSSPSQLTNNEATDKTENGKTAEQLLLTEMTQDIAKHWTVYCGVEDVVRHMSLVSAGMASRPKRPERETIFRPFSSRDAHILLQLKRTKEVISTVSPATTKGDKSNDNNEQVEMKGKMKPEGKTKNNNQYESARLIDKVLEYALRAGKAARNVQLVSDLELLKPYGSGDSKYSTEPPKELSRRVAQASLEKAIEPLVNECVEKISLKMMMMSMMDSVSGILDRNDGHDGGSDSTNNHKNENNGSNVIAHFRNVAEDMAQDDDELQWIRKQLHQPTVTLRNQLIGKVLLREEIGAKSLSNQQVDDGEEETDLSSSPITYTEKSLQDIRRRLEERRRER